MSNGWAVEQANRVGREIRKLRGKRSGQWLSDATDAIGYRVARTTISELENGKRNHVSTAELSVLAWALSVPPVRLLYPDLPDGPVEVVPGRAEPSVRAVMWFSGEIFLFDGPTDPLEMSVDELHHQGELEAGARLVSLSRHRFELKDRIKRLASAADRLRGAEDGKPFADSMASEIASVEALLQKVNLALRGKPSSFPSVDGAVVTGDGG